MKRTQIADHNNALIKQTLLIVLQSSKKCSIEYLAYMHFPSLHVRPTQVLNSVSDLGKQTIFLSWSLYCKLPAILIIVLTHLS